MKARIVYFVFFGLFTSATPALGGSCFRFPNDGGRVSFQVEGANIGSSAHFKFEFKTKQSDGILYYAEGPYHKERVYDYEEYSIGSTFGFHGHSPSDEKLNDGKWHKVEFFRNIRREVLSADGTRELTSRTGLVVDGLTVAVDDGERRGVDIRPPFILGDDPHLSDRSSNTIGQFRGNIKDFEEVISGASLTETLTNVTHCISTEFRPPDAV
ncbi:hypothetical protein MAR_006641 [Mya arenaria]|uniref:Laminin G domain-containing protein n=1 Tax=Mya arenaria TaxID=6604 RepID=A0ABY7DBU8_MYAAR|nr:hypothetical protein MAR_006641 [Mya arenaria]